MAETDQTGVANVQANAGGNSGCCQGRDWRLYNIIVLGFAFMFMFTAFQTSSMAEKSVLEGAKNETNGTFNGDGYTSLAIIYAVFSGANWIAPSVVSVVGPKISMLIGGLCYSLFIASFLKPMTWALYTGSVLVGFGAAIIWTGQGTFLIMNSNSETIGRNSGIFWALLQCSLLFGNLYVFFAFQGEVEISAHSRFTVFSVLTAVSVVGLLTLLLLRSKPGPPAEGTNEQTDLTATEGPLSALVRSAKMMITKDMLLLSVAFAYTGLELTFFSGVYGTCVGHNQHFDDSKSLIGLCGIFIGVGEIIGGGFFGLLGKKTNRYGRDPIVLLGYLCHILTFYLIFLNLPMDSPIKDTFGATYIAPSKYLALLCAFLLGLGDSSFNTQIYSLLGFLYEKDSAPAMALFKFIQSLAAAVGFFYSQHLLLQWQLLILVISGTLGSFCFFVVEWAARRKYQDGYKEL